MFTPEDIEQILPDLNDFASFGREGDWQVIKSFTNVSIQHRGQGGWIRLIFADFSQKQALELARRLLLPEPEYVPSVDGLGLAFDGVPRSEPEGGEVARQGRHRPPKQPPDLLTASPDDYH